LEKVEQTNSKATEELEMLFEKRIMLENEKFLQLESRFIQNEISN